MEERLMPEKQAHIESSLTHHDQAHVQVKRDFLRICDYTKYKLDCDKKDKPSIECMAKLLRYFEYESDGLLRAWLTKKLNSKQSNIEKPNKLAIPASINTLIALATLHTESDATIRKSLKMLERLKYITTENESGKTTIFVLESENVQSALNKEYASCTTPPKFLTPEIFDPRNFTEVPPKNSGGVLSLGGSNFTDHIEDKNNYNDDDHHQDPQPEEKPGTPQAEWQKMVAKFSKKQKEMSLLNIQSEPRVRMQMKRYKTQQVEKYTDALDFFIEINPTIEDLKSARSWLASESKIEYFANGATVHIWDLAEHWNKYQIWKKKKAQSLAKNVTYNPPIEPVIQRPDRKFRLRRINHDQIAN
jgi:hypothetical protein